MEKKLDRYLVIIDGKYLVIAEGWLTPYNAAYRIAEKTGISTDRMSWLDPYHLVYDDIREAVMSCQTISIEELPKIL